MGSSFDGIVSDIKAYQGMWAEVQVNQDWHLRILAINDPKISQNWRFWGIGINVFMGHLSTLSLSLALQKCITCQVATIGSILKFESK